MTKKSKLTQIISLPMLLIVTSIMLNNTANSASQQLEPKIKGALKAEVTLDLRKPIEPVNRRVLGVCLMYPPFSDNIVKAAKPFLNGSSVRVWLHKWIDKQEMENVFTFIDKCGIDEVLAMNPMVRMPNIIAKYNSETDNNLPLDHMKPAYLKNMINFLVNKPHQGFPNGYPISGFEVLNEPQFPQNGSWSSEDYARYLLDISHSMKSIVNTLDIGACLRNSRKYPDWNRDMLINVAQTDIDAIDFTIHHPYDFYWIKARQQIGDYYARVGGLELHRWQLQHDIRLMQTIGHGRWRMALTEWNTHPQGYDPPTNVSRDLAVAISMAAAIQMYWELGVDSANYFLLHAKYKDGIKPHFALIAEKADGTLEFNPTYYVLRLYGEKAHGIRVATECISPTFEYPDKSGNQELALVGATSIFDFKKNVLNILLFNRHRDKSIETTIIMKNFRPTEDMAVVETITGDTCSAENAIINKTRIPLEKKYLSPLKIKLPAHSVIAVTIKGKRPMTERERVFKLLTPIKSWYICGIFEQTDKSDHGLMADLSCLKNKINLSEKYEGFDGSKAFWSKIKGNQSGFVDFFDPHRIVGLDKKVIENLQGVAVSYVWSPTDRKTTLSFGADYWGMVYMNDKLVIDQRHTIGGQPAPNKIMKTAALHKGWNKITVRVASGSGGMGFWLYIENKGDLVFSAFEKETNNIPSRITLVPDEFGYINDWDVTHNDKKIHRDKNVLEMSGNPATRRTTYIHWSVPDINESGLKSAVIVLEKKYEKNAGKISLGKVTEVWSGDSVRQLKHPMINQQIICTGTNDNNQIIFRNYALTELIKSWALNTNNNHGIWLKADGINGFIGINCDKNHLPKLELIF